MYKLLVCCVLLGCISAYSGLADTNTVEMLTKRFVSTWGKKQDEDLLPEFFDDKSKIVFRSELPFGGTYEGLEGALLFGARFLRSFNDIHFEVVGAKFDEAKGVAILSVINKVMFAGSKEWSELPLIHVIEFNQFSGKIRKYLLVNPEISMTMEAYHTKAEKTLHRMMNQYFKSTYEEVMDQSHPIWTQIADDVKLQIHMYPGDLMNRTVWRGKEQLREAMEEKGKICAKSPMCKILENKIYHLKFNTIYSDDDNIWATIQFSDHDIALVSYKFDRDGKLAEENIYMTGPTKPWMVYPWPMPTTTSEDLEEEEAPSTEEPSSEETTEEDTKEDKSDFFTEPKDFNKNNWLTEGKSSQLGANTAQTLTDADQTELTGLTGLTGQTDTALAVAFDTGTKNDLEALDFLKGFDEDDSDVVNVVEKEAGSAIDQKNLMSTRRFKNEQPLYSSSYSSSFSSPFSSPYSSPYSSSYSYAEQQPQKGY